MSKYWIPTHKFQYVHWFEDMNILTRSKANRMTLKQLRGKYCEIRDRNCFNRFE